MEPTKSLMELAREARARFDALPPDKQELMLRQQRDSYIKSEIQWAKDFREGKCIYD
jgi:hypothetical protein